MSDIIVSHMLGPEIPKKAVLEYLSWYAGLRKWNSRKEMGRSSDVVRGSIEG